MTTPEPRPRALMLLLVSLLLAAIVVGAAIIPGGRGSIDEVSITNPGEFDVLVEVSGGKGSSWVSLGYVPPTATETIDGVVDQGSTWVFRFTAQGEDVEVRASRASLKANGWKVSVPARFIESLRPTAPAPAGNG